MIFQSTGYPVSSNKRRASNKRCSLKSAAPLALRSEQAPPSNDCLSLTSTAHQNVVLTRNLPIMELQINQITFEEVHTLPMRN